MGKMPTKTALVILLFIIITPIVMVAAKHDAEQKTVDLDTTIHHSESVARSGEIAENVKHKGTVDTMPKYSVQEQIEALNAAHAEISEQEVSKAETPKRYEISDTERAEIEKIVASEGGYCEYKFQALVAECILNGCEADGLRPLELFARGDFWLTHDVAPTETTKQAVSDVFDKGILPTEEKIRWYYNPDYCVSELHERFRYVFTVCGCRFFTDWEEVEK